MYKKYIDTTIRSTKTGNRTPDQRESFMDELVCLYKLTCIGIFPIWAWASEVQKPETGQKTGPRTTGKKLCANEPVWQKKISYK